jgi:inorganic triphosphatase YgiF
VSEGVEVEAKLSVGDPERVRGVIEAADPEQLAGFAGGGETRRVTVLDRYLDTEDLALETALTRVRLRESGGELLATFKRQGVIQGSVTERVELDGPANDDPDPAAWPESPARIALLEILGPGRRLVETARLRQHRLVRDVRRAETVVELSLDRLEALDGDRVAASRWELEAELKHGSRDDLGELVEALLRIPGVAAATESKRAFARIANSRLVHSRAP